MGRPAKPPLSTALVPGGKLQLKGPSPHNGRQCFYVELVGDDGSTTQPVWLSHDEPQGRLAQIVARFPEVKEHDLSEEFKAALATSERALMEFTNPAPQSLVPAL